jgi:hypothetical protein
VIIMDFEAVKKLANKYGYNAKIIDGGFHIGKTLTIEDEDVIECKGTVIRLWYDRISAVSYGEFREHVNAQLNMLRLADELDKIIDIDKRDQELKILRELKEKYKTCDSYVGKIR